MVVFTCNSCGESVKKPKAEQHITFECKWKRNGFANLCCIDCLKDFDFVTYHSHTKCMTEEERYSAPGFVPKSSSCKGVRKQSSWVDTVQILLQKPKLSSLQRSILQSISGFENIPRKKSKFMNFMKSSGGYRGGNNHVVEEVFDLIKSEFDAANVPTVTKATNPVKEEKSNVENGSESLKVKQKKKKYEESHVDEESSKIFEEENAEPQEKPLDNVDAPKSIVNGCDDQNENEGFTNVKKSKKKKKVDVPVGISEVDANVDDVEMKVESTCNDVSLQSDDRIFAKSRGKKKHKNKKNNTSDEIVVADVDKSSELVNLENIDHCPIEGNGNEKPEKKKKKRKLDQAETEEDVDSKRSRIEMAENEISPTFSWKNVVKTLLEQSKDHEMSVKKMTKKVVAEYQSFHSTNESFEDIAKKFNKKVKKLPFVIVSQDRIQLYVE